MDYTIKLVHNSGGPNTISEEVCDQMCQMGTELILLEREISDFVWENSNCPDLPLTMDALMTEGQYDIGEGLVIMQELITEKVLGFFKFVPEGKTAVIFYVVVDKECRRSGLGTALITRGKELLSSLGFDEIMLYYKSKNLRAVEFWTKNGFPPVVMIGSHKLSNKE